MLSPQPIWEPLLRNLLTGGARGLEAGAELELIDPAGTTVERLPLARHYRLDGDQLWIRPIAGGYQPPRHEPGLPDYAFSLDQARPRSITTDLIQITYQELLIGLADGYQARIHTAPADTLAELQRWDTFFYVWLSAEEEAELDRLDGTNWYGRWA